MKLLRYTILFTLLLSVTPQLSAQELPCGTTGDSEWLQRYFAGEIPPVPKFASVSYVPTRMVIVGQDDGTGYLNPFTVLNSLKQLNEDFTPADIQFYLSDIEYFNDSDLYDHDAPSTGRNIIRQNAEPGVLNVYFVERPGNTGGYAVDFNDNKIAVRNAQAGTDGHTFSHEVGHALDLRHTFFGWEAFGDVSDRDPNEPAPRVILGTSSTFEVEKANGSNCDQAGDGFCDTPPDYLFIQSGWNCNSNGEYQDSLTDPDGIRFAVPGNNYMSYSSSACQDGFSAEQITVMQTSLAFQSGIREDNSQVGAVPADGADMNLLFPEDRSTTEWSNFVELEWNSVPNADLYMIQLNVNRNFGGSVFRTFFTRDTTAIVEEGLVADRRYYWRVRPLNAYQVDSDFGDQVWQFRTGENAVSSIDPALDAAITLMPNPVNGGQDLRISGRDLGVSGQLNYQLIDPAGRILLSRENISVAASTGFSERIETAELPAGVYFLRLRLNDKLVTRRVMVTP